MVLALKTYREQDKAQEGRAAQGGRPRAAVEPGRADDREGADTEQE